MSTQLVSVNNNIPSVYGTSEAFEQGQRVAKMLSTTTMVPKDYQGNVGNCLVALEMANRMDVSPLMVMQNLHIIHGRPSWSATYLIACINTSGKFSPLRFTITGEGDDRQCVAVAKDLASGEILEGPAASISMAKKEGWYGKTGSKWQTMPDLMLRYRSAAFFSRLYAPEMAMGLMTSDEVQDVEYMDMTPRHTQPASQTISDLNNTIEKAPVVIRHAPSVRPKSAVESLNEKIEDAHVEPQGVVVEVPADDDEVMI